MRGVDVLRLWSVPVSNRGFLRRTLSQVSFAAAAGAAGMLMRRYDLVIASVPNMATELAALLIGRLRRTDVLLELRDLIPDCLTFVGVRAEAPLARMLAGYFRFVYRHVDLIAVPSEPMARELPGRGVEADRILVLPHAADANVPHTDSARRIRDRFGLQDKFVVVYAGSFSRYYGVPNTVESVILLHQRMPDVHLLLLGAGQDSDAVDRAIADDPYHSVTRAGAVEPDEVGAYLQAADLCIAPLIGSRTDGPYASYLGTKVCEYLMSGRPLIAVETRPSLGKFLERIDAGAWASPGDPEALAEVIESFAADPARARKCGENARRFALENLQREKVVAEFERQLVRKLSDRGRKSKPDSRPDAGLANDTQKMRRLVDLFLAMVCLAVAAIPMAVIALAIRIFDGAPVLFGQERIGRGLAAFPVCKFRTMAPAGPRDDSITVAGNQRITRLGAWLRRYRLDELPQFFNILAGEMSFIGPRPEIPEFVDPDNPVQREVCRVRPGLIDSATLHWLDEAEVLAGADDWKEYYRTVVVPDKLARSLADIGTRSLGNDLKLLGRVAAAVLSGRKDTAETSRSGLG